MLCTHPRWRPGFMRARMRWTASHFSRSSTCTRMHCPTSFSRLWVAQYGVTLVALLWLVRDSISATKFLTPRLFPCSPPDDESFGSERDGDCADPVRAVYGRFQKELVNAGVSRQRAGRLTRPGDCRPADSMHCKRGRQSGHISKRCSNKCVLTDSCQCSN